VLQALNNRKQTPLKSSRARLCNISGFFLLSCCFVAAFLFLCIVFVHFLFMVMNVSMFEPWFVFGLLMKHSRKGVLSLHAQESKCRLE